MMKIKGAIWGWGRAAMRLDLLSLAHRNDYLHHEETMPKENVVVPQSTTRCDESNPQR